MSVLARARAQLLNMLYISTHLSVPQGENIQKTVLYMLKLVLFMSRAEWMNGICLIWSRGRLVSPSLPVGDALAHKSDPRAEISGEIVWYDALAPRPEVLLSWHFVCACAAFL